MTSSFYSYLGVLGAILCLIVPSWEAIRKGSSNRKWYNKITKLGWVLFVVAVFIGVISGLGIHAANNEADQSKHDADSTRKADKAEIIKSVQEALKPYKLRYNDTSKNVTNDTVIVVKDHQNPVSHPLIDISGITPYAYIKNGKTDTNFIYHLDFKNIGTEVAKNLKDKSSLIVQNNNEYTVKTTKTGAFNESIIMNVGTSLWLETPYHGTAFHDTLYIYNKISYTDLENIPQQAFRRIFKSIPNLYNQQLEEANGYEYEKIKTILISRGAW